MFLYYFNRAYIFTGFLTNTIYLHRQVALRCYLSNQGCYFELFLLKISQTAFKTESRKGQRASQFCVGVLYVLVKFVTKNTSIRTNNNSCVSNFHSTACNAIEKQL